MIERIQLIMKSRNLSAAQFADEIGVQRSSVSHILTGRNNPSLDIILKILQRFPEINSDWILTGNGAMVKSDTRKNNAIQQTINLTADLSKNISAESQSLGDLFEQSYLEPNRPEPLTENNEKKIGSIEGKAEENKIEDEIKLKSPEGDKYLNSFRTIDQIVIFYSDKTFSYYRPND
jgi:transcriptional regulator with XRE-family HTH domain